MHTEQPYLSMSACDTAQNSEYEAISMQNQFLTNYTDVTFLEKIRDNLRRCNAFSFSVSFIKKAGLVLLFKALRLLLSVDVWGESLLPPIRTSQILSP